MCVCECVCVCGGCIREYGVVTFLFAKHHLTKCRVFIIMTGVTFLKKALTEVRFSMRATIFREGSFNFA